MALADVEQVSQALNVTPRHVQRLVHDGMPRATRGQYDVGRCMLWYIRYLHKALETRSSDRAGASSSLTTQRIRQAREAAERSALENARRRGELLIARETTRTLRQTLAQLRRILHGIPTRLSTELVGQDERAIFTRLAEAHREALMSFSRALEAMADSGPRQHRDG